MQILSLPAVTAGSVATMLRRSWLVAITGAVGCALWALFLGSEAVEPEIGVTI